MGWGGRRGRGHRTQPLGRVETSTQTNGSGPNSAQVPSAPAFSAARHSHPFPQEPTSITKRPILSMTPGPPSVGLILGHYRLVEQIGAGGMGLVFRASDQQLERDVAIKVLPPGMLANEAARKRFRHEALALAKVNHPNIGTVFEFGSQEGIDFLVMEYVGGISLNAKLLGGALPRKEVLRLGIQLADGLASAHDTGVIHRDRKRPTCE